MTIPGRRHSITEWEALMQRALLAGDADRPNFEQSLTRLHYLDDAFIPPPEWAELNWLIQEARHFHERRESKHLLWKWGPRQELQTRVDHYFVRAAIKGAAILRTLDDRFLLLRGRAATPRSASEVPLASWHAVEHEAIRFRQDAEPPDVWAVAEFIIALAPPMESLLKATDWLDSDDTDRERRAEDFAHFTWHAVEVARVPRAGAKWMREFRVSEANRLALISFEKLATLLSHLRRHLVRWDSGWSGPF